MSCRIDTTGANEYVFCPDDPPLASDRLRAVVQWTAVDEITARGPNVDFTIRTTELGLTPRIARDGLMGLVGNPLRLYPDLNTNLIPKRISYAVEAPGYLPRERTVPLGPLPGFPQSFSPFDDGVLALHRTPFVLRGRVVKLTAGVLIPEPVKFTSVAITNVWWTFPPADMHPEDLIEPADLVSLHPGLHADRFLSDTPSVRRRNLVQVIGQDKKLVLPAVRGTTTAKISNRIGVVPGTVLAFEPATPDRVEYIAVTAVIGASTDDQPATVTLAHRLHLDHEPGTAMHVVAPDVPDPSQSLLREGVRGDRVAFVAGISAGVVEISGGPLGVTPEYQTASLYSATTDMDGYFRLPPLSRVASVKLVTPATELVMSPDYGRYENLIDLVHQ